MIVGQNIVLRVYDYNSNKIIRLKGRRETHTQEHSQKYNYESRAVGRLLKKKGGGGGRFECQFLKEFFLH